eukprot:7689769-Alexandrium_andersonii.AAC.1
MPSLVAARAAAVLVLILSFQLARERVPVAPPPILRREAAHRWWGGRGRGLPGLPESALGALALVRLLLLDALVLMLGRLSRHRPSARLGQE